MTRPTRRWPVLIVMCLAMLVLQMDNMVLNVALPTLARDLGADEQQLQSILAAYMIPFAGLLLFAGSLSDRLGRRRLLVTGLLVFGVASGFAAWSGSPTALIAARLAMGVGGALMMPSTMSILIVTFPDETERRKAMSAFAVMSVLGLVGGPLLGGVLIAHFWWGSVFLINVPLVALALPAACVLLPESHGPARRFDPLGAVLSVLWTGSLVWAIIKLPGGLTLSVRAALIVAGAGLAAFLAWEIRTSEPMVPLRLFGSRNFSGSCFSILLLMFAFGGLLLVLTQYLQSVLGYSPTRAALALLPVVIAMMIVQPVATAAAKQIGQRAILVIGLLMLAGAFGLFTAAGSHTSFWLVGAVLVLVGAGAGLAQPAAMTVLTGAIPAELAGVGSALNDTMLQTGAAFGVAGLGSLLASGYAHALPATAPAASRKSLTEALAIAAHAHDPALSSAARDAFVHGMGTTSIVSAIVVAAGALLALLVVRANTRDSADGHQPPTMLATSQSGSPAHRAAATRTHIGASPRRAAASRGNPQRTPGRPAGSGRGAPVSRGSGIC